MIIAIGVEHAGRAVMAQREVTNMTNELLKKNADALKTVTVEAAKESERGIVDIETLKHTNEMLISTMDEVLQIQTEGKQKRQAAEAELTGIENQLREKLLQASGRLHIYETRKRRVQGLSPHPPFISVINQARENCMSLLVADESAFSINI